MCSKSIWELFNMIQRLSNLSCSKVDTDSRCNVFSATSSSPACKLGVSPSSAPRLKVCTGLSLETSSFTGWSILCSGLLWGSPNSLYCHFCTFDTEVSFLTKTVGFCLLFPEISDTYEANSSSYFYTYVTILLY